MGLAREVSWLDSRPNAFAPSVFGTLIESLPAKKLKITSRQTSAVLANDSRNECVVEVCVDEPLPSLSPGKRL